MKRITLLVVGLALLVVAYKTMLVGNDINLGGFSGLAMCLAKFGWSYTASLIVLNLFPFGYAFAKRKWNFACRSVVATVLLGLLLDITPLQPFSLPITYSLIIGSIIAGVGFGAICRADASTGGSDMIAMLLSKHLGSHISVGGLMTIIDGVVIILWWWLTKANILISFAAMVVCNLTIDLVMAYSKNGFLFESLTFFTQLKQVATKIQILMTLARNKLYSMRSTQLTRPISLQSGMNLDSVQVYIQEEGSTVHIYLNITMTK